MAGTYKEMNAKNLATQTSGLYFSMYNLIGTLHPVSFDFLLKKELLKVQVKGNAATCNIMS